ncbi:paraflagellar rod component, putative [Trypanosoma equiperdum]|uniref:Paraflagellar rod component n=4 Tax=Trypanozoon TaxID=39700 RepID=Q586J7_TRYB2|nr:hypothetical protein, conserved [Trypanosoma brucei gambiense DAL972]XP_951527.1 hypothetical protein, conserved [Trypanosoma brucei brucei TREU927]AAX79173.1 hypothetical protein, conserved [Trypanosoma brucei]RHW74063.1 paraflagellar rod component [Trypanosoma brucei equiperdum]SCU68574.1 paraflagellar rod component, putative [Trypanosoma equiperdum]AAQ15673.1 hypothetical protein, conserved [Trypanosoma brucei brucei TREU927]CBH09352.1 hypothetical protein, conserved [Trypanosoma brucei|eukprot:XP_011771658.1 hypothetical protein, conserved [Trypanosoma brucei gambiense DAL972]
MTSEEAVECTDALELVRCPSSNARVVPNRFDEEYIRGRLQEAEKIFEKAKTDVSRGLSKCEDWLGACEAFNEAGGLFASCGHPAEAARAFFHASIITRAFKDEEETTTALSLAVENMQLVEPLLAVNLMQKISETLKKGGFFFQAARCKRDSALLLEDRLGEPERAIELYREAIELYGNRSFMSSFSRGCMERITTLTVELKKYTEASKLFVEETAYAPRGRPKTRQFFLSLLCMLAEGFGDNDRYFDSLYYARKRFHALQEEERDFQHGKENRLVRKIIEANDNGSLTAFDTAVYEYRSSSTYVPDAVFENLIERCRKNLYEHLEQYI